MPERIRVRRGYELDVAERKQLAVLERLRHDECLVVVQRADLAVDVQHLRLQEGRAITGYNSFTHEKRRLSVSSRKLSTC